MHGDIATFRVLGLQGIGLMHEDTATFRVLWYRIGLMPQATATFRVLGLEGVRVIGYSTRIPLRLVY